MDRRSRATVVFRVGTLLVAIALAFGLISYSSSLTVSGYSANQCCYSFEPQCFCGYVDLAPAGTFTVLDTWNPASPQQMYFFNVSSIPVDAEVYLLNANLTTFNVWVANRTGLPLANVSLYGPQNLTWFSAYVASHRQEVANQYNVSKTNTIVRYFAPDVEPLMVVVTNGNAQSSLNLTYFGTNIGVIINPSLGFRVTGSLAGSGAVLAVFGLVLKRRGVDRRGRDSTSSSASPSPPVLF